MMPVWDDPRLCRIAEAQQMAPLSDDCAGYLRRLSDQMRRDEWGLLVAAQAGVDMRSAAELHGIAPKRAAYILNKWIGRGWYECGVGVFAGWLEVEGHRAVLFMMEHRRSAVVGEGAGDDDHAP